MSEDGATAGEAWFAALDPNDGDAAAANVRNGQATGTEDWPSVAVDRGLVDSVDEYYDWLHDASLRAADEGVRERERADDRQLIHAVRAMDDCRRTANELAERVAEWGSDRLAETGAGVEYARTVADHEAADPTGERLVTLAERCVELADEADALRAFIERAAPDVAPNLSAMAGPVLTARLVALAGGLESLAKKPSGTVQVLGAEDALFAHLRGDGPSPKHGVIYTHEYVRGIHPDDRGSAARAVAGKFTIAARVDHYSGKRRPELDAQLDERIATIRERTEDDGGAPGGAESGTDTGSNGVGSAGERGDER